jgi:hypothetical protein
VHANLVAENLFFGKQCDFSRSGERIILLKKIYDEKTQKKTIDKNKKHNTRAPRKRNNLSLLWSDWDSALCDIYFFNLIH